MNDGSELVASVSRRWSRRSSEESLVLLTAGSMRARRHPWAIAGLWVWHTILAAFVGWPAASLVRASFGAAGPGDAALWEPGGRELLDFLWRSARGAAPLATLAEIALVVGCVGGLLPMGAAMVANCYARAGGRNVGLSRSMSRALEAAPALLALWALATLAGAVLLGLGATVIASADPWLSSSFGEPRAERIEIAMGVVLVLAASGLGVAHDLARAAVVRFRGGVGQALAVGIGAFGRAPAPVWWSCAWRGLISTLPVLAGVAAAARIGGRGGWWLVLLAVLHQSAVLARVTLRASWLVCALRTVDGYAADLGARV